MHGRKALTIDDSSESTSVLTLNPENQENQQSIHYARHGSYTLNLLNVYQQR